MTSYSKTNAVFTSETSFFNLVSNPNFALGPQGYYDLELEYPSTSDPVTSIDLSNTQSYIPPLSLKVTFAAPGSNQQGIFYRVVGLPANAYVGVTARVFVTTGDTPVRLDGTVVASANSTWQKLTKVLQANGSGVVDIKFATNGPPLAGGDFFYLDAVGAFVVESSTSSVPDFFDGDTNGGTWTAFSGDSQSVLVSSTGPEGVTAGSLKPYLIDPAVTVTNLITNPSFETNTTGWVNGLGSVDNVTSLTRVTTQHYQGVASLEITWPVDTGTNGIGFSLTGLTNGASYLAIAYVRNFIGDVTECYLKVDGIANGYVSSDLLRGQWQKLVVRWTQSGTIADLILASDSPTSTDITHLDCVAVYKLQTPYQDIPYFDGSMAGHNWTGAANASTSVLSNKAVVTTQNWRTLSRFRRIGVTLQGRPLERIFESLDGVESVGVGSAGLATWDDPVSFWGDSTASWGAASSLAVVDFQSNFFYAGIQSVRVSREAAGVGGLTSDVASPFSGAHVRGGALLYLPFDTQLTHTLKILRASDDSIIRQKNLRQTAGGWVWFYTDFFISDGSQIQVSIETDGPNSSELYVGMFVVDQTTVSIWSSPDGGSSFIDLTDIPWSTDPNTFWVFPSSTNQLQVKIEMLRQQDFVHGFSVRPYYLS